jgi:hypothetical protein
VVGSAQRPRGRERASERAEGQNCALCLGPCTERYTNPGRQNHSEHLARGGGDGGLLELKSGIGSERSACTLHSITGRPKDPVRIVDLNGINSGYCVGTQTPDGGIVLPRRLRVYAVRASTVTERTCLHFQGSGSAIPFRVPDRSPPPGETFNRCCTYRCNANKNRLVVSRNHHHLYDQPNMPY